jgi:hypothetical protein
MRKYAELDDRSLDYQEYTAERVRYQPFYEMRNRPVPKPLDGEGLVPFKLRMLNDAQQLAPEYRNIDLHNVRLSAIRVFEPKIISAAMQELHHPTMVADGELKEVKRIDPTGRPFYEFYGKPSTWMSQFTTGARKRLIGIRTANQRGYIPNN